MSTEASDLLLPLLLSTLLLTAAVLVHRFHEIDLLYRIPSVAPHVVG